MYIFKLLFLIFNGYKSHNIFFSTCVPKPLPPSISDLKFRVQIKRSLSFKILESKFHQIQRKKFKLNKQISDDTVFRRDFISHFYCVPSPSFWKKGRDDEMNSWKLSDIISLSCFVLLFFVNRLKCAFFVWQ